MDNPESWDDPELSPDELADLDNDAIRELLDAENEHRAQDIGGAAVDDLADSEQEIPPEHILETTGLLSHVKDEDGDVIGHIYMTEYDDCDDPMIPVSMAVRKPGISVFLRSSPGNYHIYNLSVRPFEDQLRDVTAGTGDLGHCRWSARRGYFVLRVLEKRLIETGEVYKPAPTLLAVWVSDSDYPQSERHLRFFRSIANEQGDQDIAEQLDQAAEDHDLTGSTLVTEHYQTLTDEAKEVRK